MMEIASTSETSVNFYQTTRRYNPDDGHLQHKGRRRAACGLWGLKTLLEEKFRITLPSIPASSKCLPYRIIIHVNGERFVYE
jgi:hypothetical protein